MEMCWTTQNEAADEDGALLQDEESFDAEMKLLESWGCPDVATAKFVAFEVTSYDDSTITAEVSAAAAKWLEDELDAWLIDTVA